MKWDEANNIANNSALARKKSSSQHNNGTHQRNKTQVMKKNIVSQTGKILAQGSNINAQDQALLLNQNANYMSQSQNSAITSPMNANNQNMLLLYNNQNGASSNLAGTESTHPNSEAQGSQSVVQKRLRS